jgi:hypothetical protein
MKSMMGQPANKTTVKIIAIYLVFCFAFIPRALGQRASSSGTELKKWSPAQKPTMTGPIDVGVVLILFPDTKLQGGIPKFKTDLDSINGLTQEDYFKIYSNGITWPVAKIYPSEDEASIYHAPECYGYYCKYDYWSDPIGWHGTGEGQKRAAMLKADALREAKAKSPGAKFRTMAFCYITTFNPEKSARPDIRRYYAAICGQKPEVYPDPARPGTTSPKADLPELKKWEKPFLPWDYYHPSVSWGEPMWPNSSIQFNNASAGTFAHEFGHVLGAPDIYRIGRSNDGIGGAAVLLSFGPTATAFSRYYHHGFVPEKNYPTITQSGTYTLSPRSITPEKDEALGFVIPSRDPHYFYQIEYLYGENPALCAGGGDEAQTRHEGEHLESFATREGVLISVINLNESNYLGSPDGLYTYRPNDPWFRGLGDVSDCLFGLNYNRQEFNMKTEPSSRLPNLLDGGVSFKNITEHQGTASFDVEIDKTPLLPAVYQAAQLPLMKLDSVDEVLPTSFRMKLIPKFRGEPLVDQYGMCWSTSKNPEVSYDHFTLSNCNYEMYQGRALNLKPNTKYYVRGWATNSKGIRYSDEELEVKTPATTAEITEVEPLLLDSFSNNGMLHDKFSLNVFDAYGAKAQGYEAYAPVAVLGKLAAYYRPDNLLAPHANVAPNPSRGDALGPGHELIVPLNPNGGSKKSSIDFGRLHWDPYESDPVWRTVETISLFEQMHTQAKACKMYDKMLSRDFVIGFNKIFPYKMEPQFQPVTAQNLDATLKLIKSELINARPVLVIESPQPHTNAEARLQWGLIDGFKDDTVHIDFPLDTEILKEKDDRLKYTTLDSLIVKYYDLAIVSHINF